MNDFKQCPNGHYYQGDICPYCEREEKKPNNNVKVCSNHHAYNSGLNVCPICDSAIVVDEYEFGHDTIECPFIRLVKPLTVKVEGQFHQGISYIIVCISRGYKQGYAFSRGGSAFEDYIWIGPEEEIQIGETIILGKELMKMCDLIIDNHVSFMVHDGESEYDNEVAARMDAVSPSTDVPSYMEEMDKIVKVINIGRSVDDDYIVHDPRVTRHHCRIELLQSGQFRIENFGENGTFVNGKMIEGKVVLQKNDVIRIGNTVIGNPYDADVPDERGIKRCLNGHYYKGEGCRHCEKEHYPVFFMDEERNPVYYHGITKGPIPICPHCGRPVRKETPKPKWPIVGSVKSAYDRNVPWNYQWDGTCENCGRYLGFCIVQTISENNTRCIYVREASKQVKTFIDAVAGLSGVEIEQKSNTDTDQSMFISTNELKCLINALQDSPLLEQLDWREDYT